MCRLVERANRSSDVLGKHVRTRLDGVYLTVVDEEMALEGEGCPEQSLTLLALKWPLL